MSIRLAIHVLLLMGALVRPGLAGEKPPVKGAVLMPSLKSICTEIVFTQGGPDAAHEVRGTLPLTFPKGTSFFDPRDITQWEQALAHQGPNLSVRQSLAQRGVHVPQELSLSQVAKLTDLLDIEFVMGKGIGLPRDDRDRAVQNIEDGYRHGFYAYYTHRSTPQRHVFENPAYRGVLRFSRFKELVASTTFLKEAKGALIIPNSNGLQRYRVSFNTAFDDVVKRCQNMSRYTWVSLPDQPPRTDGLEWKIKKKIETTWITEDIFRAYSELHKRGKAHSIEVWAPDQSGLNASGQIIVTKWKLVAGQYGVFFNGVFTGESVFHDEEVLDDRRRFEGDDGSQPARYAARYSGAGRVAVLALIDHLAALGLEWIDMQGVTNLTAGMGADFVPRSEYLSMRDRAEAKGIPYTLPEAYDNYRIDFSRWENP